MSNRINVLDKNTINRIAAGEVIDRPASIIKELIENSIDAGATAVSVEIRGGGIELIRITDNGCGIDKDDVRVAFIRHSTSKIRNAEDLSFITSLGFRGEALASIAAVADVELITKTKEAFSAVRYHISGGEEKEFEEIGAPDGTTFIIRDIFGCVPVRRKFLKSSATEGSYCNEAVERIALSHPNVSIKYVNNGRNVLYTNGSGKLKEVIFGIYGRDIASEIAELKYEGSKGISVSGCICKPAIARNNRNTENTFVNGRFIKSPILFKAVEDAYQPYLMQHKYPFTALYIDINPANMDVNVHPTKQEVRFENPEAVYNTVYEAVTDVLSGKALVHRAEREQAGKNGQILVKTGNIPEPFETERRKAEKEKINCVSEGEGTYTVEKRDSESLIICNVDNKASEQGKVFNQNGTENRFVTAMESKSRPANGNDIETDSKCGTGYGKTTDANSKYETENTGKAEIQIDTHIEKNTANMGDQRDTDTSDIASLNAADDTYTEEKTDKNWDNNVSSGSKYVQQTLFDNAAHIETRQEFNNVFSNGYRIVGQIFDTYWIVECNGCVYLIDQHAAHEKILYEKFMNDVGKDDSTQLLSPPIIVSLSSIEEDTAVRYREELEKNGFVLEHFGGHEYALSEIPLNLYGVDPKSFLLELLDELSNDLKGSVIVSIKGKIATCACKAAVKGNMALSEPEAKELLNNLLSAENPFNCPHGRPIIIDITKKEIEKKFKRIL